MKAMELIMNSNLTIKINKAKIEKVENIKYFSFIIDKNQKFKEFICKKIAKTLHF